MEARPKKLAGSARWNNRQRARYGTRAVRAGTPDYAQNDARTNLVDTLANLRHHAHVSDIDFASADKAAEGHFDAELRGEDL